MQQATNIKIHAHIRQHTNSNFFMNVSSALAFSIMEESAVVETFDRLVEAGVAFYDSKQRVTEHTESNLKFQFIITSALDRKPTFQKSSNQESTEQSLSRLRPGSDIDTSRFEIGTVGDSHILAVNKFCYARPHLILIASDGYRRQYEPLDEADLTAAWSTIAAMESDYIAIYNCGKDGGCSRLHKHMQVMPMPSEHFATFLEIESGQEPKVPFQWYYRRFAPAISATPSELIEAYNDLLSNALRAYETSTGIVNGVKFDVSYPHNVILSKRWIVVIPRRQGDVNKEAAANALGMLGVIAVAKEQDIGNWLQLGPVELLKILGVPRA